MPGTFNIDLTALKAVSYPYPAATVTTSAMANTFGDYVEVIAAGTISSDFYLCGLTLYHDAASATTAEYEMAVGAGGSESPIATIGLRVPGSSADVYKFIAIDPIKIAGNARVAIRCRDTIATANSGHATIIIKEQ